MPLIVFADERPPLTGKALDLIAHVPRRVLDPTASEDALIDAVRDADLVVSGLRPISGAAIEAGRRLKGIVVSSVETDHVDLAAATARRIPVAHTPGVHAVSVAELAIGLTLAVVRSIPQACAAVHAGAWVDDSLRFRLQSIELSGKTMGIVGLGHVGLEVARRARVLGMRVVSSTKRPSPEREAEAGVRFVRLPELLEMADVVVLCCALTDETRGLIGAEALRRMKPSAYLVNVARGALLDEAALAEALRSGKIKGAALDVLSKEPPGDGHPLFALDNVIITCHLGGRAREAAERLCLTVAEEILRILRGEMPQNLANRELLVAAK